MFEEFTTPINTVLCFMTLRSGFSMKARPISG